MNGLKSIISFTLCIYLNQIRQCASYTCPTQFEDYVSNTKNTSCQCFFVHGRYVSYSSEPFNTCETLTKCACTEPNPSLLYYSFSSTVDTQNISALQLQLYTVIIRNTFNTWNHGVYSLYHGKKNIQFVVEASGLEMLMSIPNKIKNSQFQTQVDDLCRTWSLPLLSVYHPLNSSSNNIYTSFLLNITNFSRSNINKMNQTSDSLKIKSTNIITIIIFAVMTMSLIDRLYY